MSHFARALLCVTLLSACGGEAPVLADATLAAADVGQPYSAQLSATGGTAPVTYGIAGTGVPPGLTLSTSGALTGTPTESGSFTFQVVAIDSARRSDSAAFSLEVRPLPALSIATASLRDAYTGIASAQALIAEGGVAPYTWSIATGALPAGLVLSSSGELSGTATATGHSTVTLAVRDAAGQSAVAPFTLTVYSPPSIATATLAAGAIKVPYSQTVVASGGRTPITVTTASALPTGLTWNGSTLSGTPTSAGTFPLTFTATDLNGRFATQTLSLTIHASVAFVTEALPEGQSGAVYTAALEAVGGVAPYSYQRVGGTLPSGLTLSAAGVLSGTPTSAGTFTFTVRVTDSEAHTADRSFTLDVLAPLQIGSQTLPDGYVGTAFTHTFAATGGRGPYTWTRSSGTLPGGISLTTSGSLTGQPNSTGTFSFSVVVTDASGHNSAPRAVSVRVAHLPSVTTASLPSGYEANAYAATLLASGGFAPLTWTLDSGTLPSGLSLSTGGALEGTPSAAGTTVFAVRVTDANGRTATGSLSLTIHTRVWVDTVALPDAYRGATYAAQLTASGGTGTLTWTRAAGALPTGLSLSSTGVISGTVGGSAASATVTARATDSNGQYGEAPFTISVYALPAITTTSLPNGRAGSAYQEGVAISGGKAPFTLTVASGALPPGLTVDSGSVSVTGTPTTPGDYSFTLGAADANGRSDTQSFTMSITTATSAAPFEVASWNIEWFGATGLGPSDEALQLQNASGVIADAGFDAWGLGEIVSTTQFNALVANLSGYAGFMANDPTVTNGSSYYHSSEQKVAFLYDTSKVQVLGASVILTANDFEFAGRPPLRVDTRVTVNGETVDMTFIIVHLKAGDGSADRDRRVAAAGLMKGYVDANLASAEVMILGDWNDDVDESIVSDQAGGYLSTPFQNFLDDSANFRFVTQNLSEAGLRSTVFYDNVIDHHLASNEVTALHVPSSQVVRPDLWPVPVANYGDTTSDHYPVVSRYDLTGAGGAPSDGGTELPPDAGSAWLYLNEVLYDEPAGTLPDGGYGQLFDYEFVEVRNAGTVTADLAGWKIADVYSSSGAMTGTTRHIFASGTQLAPGAAIVVFGGAQAMPTAPANAVVASTGQLSFHINDEVRLISPAGVVKDFYGWTGNLSDGLSVNRSPDGEPTGGMVPHWDLSGAWSSPGTRVDGTGW